MQTHHRFGRTAGLAMLSLVGIMMAGCGGGGAESNLPQPTVPRPAPPPSTTAGTGVLTIIVTDSDGRPVKDAYVSVFNRPPTLVIDTALTNTNGAATIRSLPATVDFSIDHEFGYHGEENVNVPQQGDKSVGVTLLPVRPRPTVALLPVEIRSGSINPDRNELILEVAVIASPSAPFVLSEFGDFSAAATPSLGLELGDDANNSRRDCFVWLDQRRTVPFCGALWGSSSSPYTVSVEQFRYDVAGPASLPPKAGSAQSTMLVIDQSRRVSALDPGAFRSFAAKRFIERVVSQGEPKTLSVAGFAGSGGDLATPLSLPAQPLWVTPGGGTVFTTDEVILKSNVGALELLIGGVAPVFDALDAAVSLTAVSAPTGVRTVVALLGGGDDRELTEAERRGALASLRQLRDDTGVGAILIDAVADTPDVEHRAIAELAAAMRAPTISLGVSRNRNEYYTTSWAAGSYAALDLAADMIQGSRVPTLSAVFRVKANSPGAFRSGAILHGVLYVDSENCPVGCWEVPLAFAVKIP